MVKTFSSRSSQIFEFGMLPAEVRKNETEKERKKERRKTEKKKKRQKKTE